jgi:acyl-CoA thioester hydrolase
MSEPPSGHDGPFAAPCTQASQQVPAEWIDYNGHMNVGYYTFAFDRAIDTFLEDELGTGPTYAARLRMGPYTLQNHIHYLGELLQGEHFHVEVMLADHDAKRLHVFMTMFNDDDGSVAATAEQLLMNVDLDTRRPALWPDWAVRRLDTMATSHTTLCRPAQFGAPMGIRRKN